MIIILIEIIQLNFYSCCRHDHKKGYTVVRAGHLVEDAIETNNEKIIDYFHRGFRTDFLDVYLASKCEYIFGSDTGYFALPGWNFRKPILYVNFSQLEEDRTVDGYMANDI